MSRIGGDGEPGEEGLYDELILIVETEGAVDVLRSSPNDFIPAPAEFFDWIRVGGRCLRCVEGGNEVAGRGRDCRRFGQIEERFEEGRTGKDWGRRGLAGRWMVLPGDGQQRRELHPAPETERGREAS